jgi:hypothetical protein
MRQRHWLVALDRDTFLGHTFQMLAVKINRETEPSGTDHLDLSWGHFRERWRGMNKVKGRAVQGAYFLRFRTYNENSRRSHEPPAPEDGCEINALIAATRIQLWRTSQSWKSLVHPDFSVLSA